MQNNRLAVRALLVAALTSLSVSAAAADSSAPLSRVAAQLGFAYAYLGPDDTATLTRPGLTILVRPGQALFDVNDHSESMDSGSRPRASGNDLYVSREFVRQLAEIAHHRSFRSSSRGFGIMTAPHVSRPAVAAGPITLDVTPVPGRQVLSVVGHAPPHAPIVLTLLGTFASDIPDAVLNRTVVTADQQGNFQTDMPLAPGFHTGALITLEASSVAGVTSARKRLVVPPPNAGLIVPSDEDQRSIR